MQMKRSAVLLGSIAPDIPLYFLSIGGLLYYHYIVGWPLREAAKHHIVIAITHDMELAKLADQVVMMKDGRLWASDRFEALVDKVPEFRQMINMREEAML